MLFKTKEDYGMLKEARRLGTLPAPGLDPILEIIKEIIKDIIIIQLSTLKYTQ